MAGYDDFAETFGASRQNMHWEDTQILLDDFVQNFGATEIWKIADIGCGNGRLLRHILQVPNLLKAFQSHHTHYFGADLSEKLLGQAEKDISLTLAADMIEWRCMDMRDVGNIFSRPLFHACFFIASFHHLETFEQRLSMLKETKKILLPGGKIYMTNWHLLSEQNQKYLTSQTADYPDGSADFLVKIGKYKRFYHSFSLQEYQNISQEIGLKFDKYEFRERNSIVVFS